MRNTSTQGGISKQIQLLCCIHLSIGVGGYPFPCAISLVIHSLSCFNLYVQHGKLESNNDFRPTFEKVGVVNGPRVG